MLIILSVICIHFPLRASYFYLSIILLDCLFHSFYECNGLVFFDPSMLRALFKP